MLIDLDGVVAGGVTVLAGNPVPPADKGPEFGKASPVGLVVVLLLLLATVFLIRSMNKHLRRVPESFDPPEQRAAAAEPEGDTSAPDPTPSRPVGSPDVDPPPGR